MGGIGFQQLFIFIFAVVITKFHREILRESRDERIRQALLLLYVVYAALFLITVSGALPDVQVMSSANNPLGIGSDHFPTRRVLGRSRLGHSQPRSISVLPRLAAHVDCTRPFQPDTPRSGHAGKTRGFPQPEGKETARQKCQRCWRDWTFADFLVLGPDSP